MDSQDEAPPALCPECSILVEKSNLEWVRCGGMAVGMHKQPMVWRLRDKYSSDCVKLNAWYAQRLAAAARLVYDLKEHIYDPAMLERIDRFVKNNNQYRDPNR